MKTKGYAAIAMLLIMASALAANFVLACDLGGPAPTGEVFGDGDILEAVRRLVEAYEVDSPPITMFTADICTYIWTATDTQIDTDLDTPTVRNWRVTYRLDETGTPTVDVQLLDIPCDGCGDFLKREVINFDEEEDSIKEDSVEELILLLIGDTETPIIRVEAEICLHIVDSNCDETVEKWLVTIVQTEPQVYDVEAILFEWHEIIANNMAFEGIIGECRGNELELVYLGRGRYESGKDDVAFYVGFKVNDDPEVRDLQVTIELVKDGPMMYTGEFYHSMKNGEFGVLLPFEHTVKYESPSLTILVITDPLC